MKKFILIMIFFIFPIEVFAENDVLFTCTNEIMQGNQVECSIQLADLNQKILGMQVNLAFPSEFSYLETNIESEWEILSSSSTGFAIANLDGVSKDGKVATIKFLVSNDAKIGEKYFIQLKNLKLTDGSKDIELEDKSSDVQILSVLDILDSITVNGQTLLLKDGVVIYTIDLYEQLEIVAKLKREGFSFEESFGPRTVKDLELGTSTHYLKIVKEDQEIISFTFEVNNLGKMEVKEEEVNPNTGGNYGNFMIILLLFSCVGILYFDRKIRFRRKIQ